MMARKLSKNIWYFNSPKDNEGTGFGHVGVIHIGKRLVKIIKREVNKNN
jgi:hypothetical protein